MKEYVCVRVCIIVCVYFPSAALMSIPDLIVDNDDCS